MNINQYLPFDRPKVSVVTAAFNREKHLKRCIESVLSQTYQNWEHLIIDDGSSDKTYDLVKSYCLKDSRIRYAYHSNRGASLSWNVGLCMAAGDYICILDSDDYYLPNHMESRIQYFEENPEIDFIHGGIIVIGDEYVVDANNLKNKIHISECSQHVTFFGKKETFRSTDGYRQVPIGRDLDMLNRIIENNYKTVKLTDPKYQTAVWVRTEGSLTTAMEKKMNSKVS